MASTNRTGRVSAIDYEAGTYEVTYFDRGKSVTRQINAMSNGEYKMPCVFATLGGECGIMGWIKTTKDRNRERKWEQEDKQEAKAEAAEVPPGDMPGA